MLPNKAIIEFQEIYSNELNIKISFEEAKVKSENFIQLFDLITNKDKYEKFESRVGSKTNH